MHENSSNFPCRKTLFTTNCRNGRSFESASVITTQMIVGLTTGHWFQSNLSPLPMYNL
jgi:hypothetical protein